MDDKYVQIAFYLLHVIPFVTFFAFMFIGDYKERRGGIRKW